MIYVDDPMKIGGRFDGWCHMWSSLTDVSPEAAEDELHVMATLIGISTRHFQHSSGASGDFPHYDLSPKHRRKALANGAEYKRLREWVVERQRWQERQDERRIHTPELNEGDTLHFDGKTYTVLAVYQYRTAPDKVSLQVRTPSGETIDIEVDAASTLIVNDEPGDITSNAGSL